MFVGRRYGSEMTRAVCDGDFTFYNFLYICYARDRHWTLWIPCYPLQTWCINASFLIYWQRGGRQSNSFLDIASICFGHNISNYPGPSYMDYGLCLVARGKLSNIQYSVFFLLVVSFSPILSLELLPQLIFCFWYNRCIFCCVSYLDDVNAKCVFNFDISFVVVKRHGLEASGYGNIQLADASVQIVVVSEYKAGGL